MGGDLSYASNRYRPWRRRLDIPMAIAGLAGAFTGGALAGTSATRGASTVVLGTAFGLAIGLAFGAFRGYTLAPRQDGSASHGAPATTGRDVREVAAWLAFATLVGAMTYAARRWLHFDFDAVAIVGSAARPAERWIVDFRAQRWQRRYARALHVPADNTEADDDGAECLAWGPAWVTAPEPVAGPLPNLIDTFRLGTTTRVRQIEP